MCSHNDIPRMALSRDLSIATSCSSSFVEAQISLAYNWQNDAIEEIGTQSCPAFKKKLSISFYLYCLVHLSKIV